MNDPAQKSIGDALETCSMFALVLYAWDILASKVSIMFSTWRAKVVLSLLGCRYGKSLRVDGKLIIRSPRKGAITLGNNVKINSRFRSNLVGMTNPTMFHCSQTGSITLGDNTGCSSTIFSSRVGIRIGRHVNIGGNVRIYDHDYHSLDAAARRDPKRDQAECRTALVTIGDDAFIGANSIILKGVTIGDRSIIGAGSVVAIKEIPADSVVAGNPATIIRRSKEAG